MVETTKAMGAAMDGAGKWVILAVVLAAAVTRAALGDTPIPDGTTCLEINEVFLTPEWFAKVSASVATGMVAARAIAEILLRIAPLLGAHGAAAAKVARFLWIAGQLVGAIGVGTPKPTAKVLADGDKPYRVNFGQKE